MYPSMHLGRRGVYRSMHLGGGCVDGAVDRGGMDGGVDRGVYMCTPCPLPQEGSVRILLKCISVFGYLNDKVGLRSIKSLFYSTLAK